MWGGESDAEGGYDCSGLVQDAFKRLGIKMPRVARDQQHIGVRVNSLAEAKPGDLLTFGNPAHHIGIYAGNGEWIEAPRTGLKVCRHKLTR
ncbi:C40 family peptidase, partial [Pseudoalteromonas sp. SYSU M81241]